jgi:uncharacterized protein YneF (UPF0154 family)
MIITIITGILCFLAGLFAGLKIMEYGLYLGLKNNEIEVTEKGLKRLYENDGDNK